MAGPRNVALIRFNHSSQRAAVSFSLGLDLKCGLVMIRLRQELQCISVHRCPKEHQLWSSRYHTAVKTAVGTGLSWGRLQRGAPPTSPASPRPAFIVIPPRSNSGCSYFPGISNAILALSTWELSLCPKPKELLHQ